jgi:hypothetical protein
MLMVVLGIFFTLLLLRYVQICFKTAFLKMLTNYADFALKAASVLKLSSYIFKGPEN